MIIGIGLIVAIIMGILGRYVAKEKNRSKAEGFWLGFLFSILGVIIVALLPTKDKIVKIENSEPTEPLVDNLWIYMLILFLIGVVIILIKTY
tara:strand:+ start:324 stop:599 length:276 start_codon:yes stop_codon:yes gene_type:complete